MNAIEMAFNSLVEMDKKEKPLKEFILGKHKQEERKQGRGSSIISP
jgi:hypothetical protein